MANPSFSIVVVSWNVRDHLERCLASLKQVQSQDLADVIVVDNGSTDGSVELVRERYPWVKLVALDHNAGFAAACNQGASIASGSHLVFLNPDTEVAPDFIGQLTRFWLTHPKVGVVGGRLTNDDGTFQPSVRGLPGLWSSLLDALKLLQRLPGLAPRYLARDFDYRLSQPAAQVMGACFSVPRLVWRQLGGFDEGYWIWFEEADFCARIARHGHLVWYEPTIQVRHTQAASFNQVNYLAKHRQFTKSLLRYLKLHNSCLAVALVWLASRLWFALAPMLDFVHPRGSTTPAHRSAPYIKSTLAVLACLELVSWWGWHSPLVGSVATVVIGAAWLGLAYRNLSLGIVWLLLELIVGSFGNLLSLKIGTLTLSLRQVLFLAALSLMTWWLVTGRRLHICQRSGLAWWYLAALGAIGWGSVMALSHGRGLGDFFLDAQRYLYLLLWPLYLEAFLNKKTLEFGRQLLPLGLAWLALKTTFTLYLFSHLGSEQTLGYYQWWRQTGFGEITYVSGNFFRVFSQSQVFGVLGAAVGLAWLYATLKRASTWYQSLNCYLFLWMNLSLVLMSFSRSFWLGTAVAWGMILVVALRKGGAWGFGLRYLATSVLLTLAAVGFTVATTQVAWPWPPQSAANASLFAKRLSRGEAASNSRLALLPPLGQAVLKHPLVGSGFGTTVTFYSLDPRLVRQTAGGSGLTTTYAFEWGYLDLWLKLGLVGLLGFLGFLGYGLWPAWRSWWRQDSVGASLASAGAALLVLNLTTPYLNHPLGLGALMALIAVSQTSWRTKNVL